MFVGIDPDIDKSGLAITTNGKDLTMMNLNFVDLLAEVEQYKQLIKCVYIEAGWLNKKSNWHEAKNQNIAVSIGRKVGENHAAGKLLHQSIEAKGLKVILVKPTSKKLDGATFNKLTGWNKRTNQECRDAAMLIWGR